MSYVVDIREIDGTQVGAVGGKGAALGELAAMQGIRVPPGFCVTTDAFTRVLDGAPGIDDHLARLADVSAGDAEAIRALGAEIRAAVEHSVIPDEVAAAITAAVGGLGDDARCAVRSSATAEDLPTASFAGQHDSFLNVTGPDAVLTHIRRCWASLFSERAVTYRLHNGFDHRAVRMAVVVQRMVDADAAGVLFTADPVTGNRMVASVEATRGLGEALVSGQVNADSFQVRGGQVVARTIAPARAEQLPRADQPALTDAQAIQLVQFGRQIEAHFGRPQDVEWCLTDGDVSFVQSRPITTLFPVPQTADAENHVYVSVGHGQMMTDAMRPLGLSMWQMMAMVEMHEAGGRLFVDVTQRLAAPASRAATLDALGRGDPLIGDALRTILDRGDFITPAPEPDAQPNGSAAAPAGRAPDPIDTDPAIVTALIDREQAAIAELTHAIQLTTGPALFDFVRQAFTDHKRTLGDPLSLAVIMAGMQAAWWLNEQLETWLGEKNAADTLTLAAPGNITSEMGLALLDVADVIRPHAHVVRLLERVVRDPGSHLMFLENLAAVPGGPDARAAIEAYLNLYGMRCVGEIDITRPRWSERPATVVPMILDNVRNVAAGEANRRLQHGRRRAELKERELLERLNGLPDGETKADEAKRMIDRVRTFSGYREYPKYGIIARFFVYKQALLREADQLARAGVVDRSDDVFHLTFDEFQDAVSTGRADRRLITRRKHAFRAYQALTPPRVLTSDGEIVSGSYRRDDVPAGALVGLAVSSGTVEGRARVIRDIADADIEPGDILVTISTDPSWTPLFLGLTGLVTEVGGLMTHGAVIAREYGLPAVVGVEHATRLIADGQRIRVDGTDGVVEILPDPSRAPAI